MNAVGQPSAIGLFLIHSFVDSEQVVLLWSDSCLSFLYFPFVLLSLFFVILLCLAQHNVGCLLVYHGKLEEVNVYIDFVVFVV